MMGDFFEKAMEFRTSGNNEEARLLLLKACEEKPDCGKILYETACVHDVLGLENEAVPYYEAALTCFLNESDRRGALLGLGSTYRCLGQYEFAKRTLEHGMKEFPDAKEFGVFYAMVLFNLNQHHEAMETVLKMLVETTNDNDILSFKKAILFYSNKLDVTWIKK